MVIFNAGIAFKILYGIIAVYIKTPETKALQFGK